MIGVEMSQRDRVVDTPGRPYVLALHAGCFIAQILASGFDFCSERLHDFGMLIVNIPGFPYVRFEIV